MQSNKINTKNTFVLIKRDKINDSVIEFAQMCILLALNKFPNSYFEQAKFISQKFEEKYHSKSKGKAGPGVNPYQCAVIEKGYGYLYYYYSHLLIIGYNTTQYFIWN